jgi:tungstate transport system substrate-binding protein
VIRQRLRFKARAALVLCACVILAVPVLLPGCGKQARSEVVLATGTSPWDTGLLNAWIPMFEASYPYDVKVVSVGSGKAIQAARDGECDVTLTNSPEDERQVLTDVLTINSKAVMHNSFVVAGPAGDPAGVRGQPSPIVAFSRIMESGSAFVSRADGSGINANERAVWQSVTGLDEPVGQWYIKSGKGMGDTLLLANERNAYVLTDKATYLVYQDRLDLEILLEVDMSVANNYVVMEVNPAAFPDVNAAGAQAFSEFVTGREAQEFLNTFGVEEYGEQLFYPDAL